MMKTMLDQLQFRICEPSHHLMITRDSCVQVVTVLSGHRAELQVVLSRFWGFQELWDGAGVSSSDNVG